MDEDYAARMKRIEEKHEALAQSSELLHLEMLQQTRNIEKLGERVDQLTVESVANQQLIIQVMTAMQQLIGIVTAHERRIQALEGQ